MRHAFLAFTNPEQGVEATFNAWYDRHHVPEVLRYGRGFTGCRRFRLLREVRRGEVHAWAYLALYGLELDDLALLARSPWVEESPPLTPFAGFMIAQFWYSRPSAPASRAVLGWKFANVTCSAPTGPS